jgi:DNA-binding NarL/FixJ family response regulator
LVELIILLLDEIERLPSQLEEISFLIVFSSEEMLINCLIEQQPEIILLSVKQAERIKYIYRIKQANARKTKIIGYETSGCTSEDITNAILNGALGIVNLEDSSILVQLESIIRGHTFLTAEVVQILQDYIRNSDFNNDFSEQELYALSMASTVTSSLSPANLYTYIHNILIKLHKHLKA